MNTKRKTFSAALAGILAVTLLAGCGQKPAVNFTSTSGGSAASSPADNIQAYGKTISVADIKQAYSAEDDAVMPLYNVADNETFEFRFKSNWLDADPHIYPIDLVSVHTDPSCSEQSKLYTSNLFDEEDPYLLKVSPIGGVLTTDSEDHAAIEEKREVWGNASMYYIALWCDPEAEGFEKLEKPIVIPFTVKHELAVPTVKGVVDATGRFKLVWDAVEGATGYNIYWYGNVSPESHITGEKNIPVPGAESAYDVHSECSLIKTGYAEEPEFDCFAGKDHGLGIHYHDEILDEDDVDYVFGQNYCVNGSYFVSAVFGDKESGLSNIVNTADLILPYEMTDETDLMFKHFDSESELPRTVDVRNIDGSVTQRAVSYKFHWGRSLIGTPVPQFRYSIEGTAITGEVTMNILAVPADFYNDRQEGELPRGFSDSTSDNTVTALPDNNTDFNPDSDVPTIIEPSDGKPGESNSEPEENSSEPEENSSEPEENSSEPVESGSESVPAEMVPGASDNAPLAEQQIANTQLHVENGNGDSVERSDCPVFAESPEEEWLARNLIAGNKEISLEAFPSLQIHNNLADVFQKVYYQNPMILGITSYRYNYATLTLEVEYCYNKDTLSEKQGELLASANEITSKTISEKMTDEEKCRALYDYLNDNAVYDSDAVKAAESVNFIKDSSWGEFEDAFNAHGVLVQKKGVCQSYALAYKLLCEISGVDCKVITGYLSGTLPHAWNSVSLDGEWYQTDCTNNAQNCGIPYFLYLAGKDDLKLSGYTEDKLYELDLAAGKFSTEDSKKEYYEANGLFASNPGEFKKILGDNIDNPQKVFAVRFGGEISEDDIVKAVKEVFNMKNAEDRLPSLGMSVSDGFIVLISK